MYRLIKNHEDASNLYILSDEQITVVEEAELQIKKGETLDSEQADNEIEGWLER